jgi:hypothetical protein
MGMEPVARGLQNDEASCRVSSLMRDGLEVRFGRFGHAFDAHWGIHLTFESWDNARLLIQPGC